MLGIPLEQRQLVLSWVCVCPAGMWGMLRAGEITSPGSRDRAFPRNLKTESVLQRILKKRGHNVGGQERMS